MRKLFVWVAALIVTVSGLLSCSTQHISQDEIIAFVDDFEKKAEYISGRLDEIKWNQYIGSETDSLDYYLQTWRALYSSVERLTLLKSYLSLVKDETYKRKLELIYRLHQRGVIDYNPNLTSVIKSLGPVRAESEISISYEGNLYSLTELWQSLASEVDRNRRRGIYAAILGGEDNIAENLVTLTRQRNQATSRIGYNSYYDLMLTADGIDKGELLDLLNDLDRLTAGPYRQAIDSLKNVSGVDDIRDWDVYYAIHQNDAQQKTFYTQDRQMSLLNATLEGLGLKVKNLPIYFRSVVPSHGDPGNVIIAVHPPGDIRVPIRMSDGTKSLNTLFTQAGRALYAAQIDPQDFLMVRSPTPGFEAGMARMISALSELGAWKIKYAGMPEPMAARSAATGKFLTIYNLRKALVDIFFERELYADPYADLQEVYSRLFEKYMMFPLGVDVRPWAVDLDYISNAVSKQNRLIGECVAAQTYHYLRERYDSVLDNQHTREFLVQNYYRFGARDDWQTLLERGTGERLKADYYLSFPND